MMYDVRVNLADYGRIATVGKRTEKMAIKIVKLQIVHLHFIATMYLFIY